MMNNNGVIEGPYGNSGSWETREYGEIDDPGCPYAPLNGKPCYYETDHFNQLAVEELAATSPEQPFYMQVDYTTPHGDFRKPAGPQPATRDIGRFAGAPLPDNRAEGFNEANVNDKPRFIREAPYLSATEIHTYRVYYQNVLASLVSVDEGVKNIVNDSAPSTGCATPTSSSPPTTASSSASTGWSAASSSPTSPRPTCR